MGDPVLVVIPSSVRTVDDAVFYGRKRLRKVVCLEGSRLDLVGADCFRKSGLEDIEFTGPGMEIREDALSECTRLREINAPEECRGYIRQRAPESAAVLPPRYFTVGNKYLWELRVL